MFDRSTVPFGKVAWVVVGTGIVALAAFVVYSFVGAIVVGVFLYYALRPLQRWLDDRVTHPGLSAMVVFLAVGLPMLLVLAFGGLTAARELEQFMRVTNLGEYRSLIEPYLDVAALTQSGRVTQVIRNALPRVVEGLGFLFTWSLRLFVAITVAYYLLRDDEKSAAWFRRTFADEDGGVEFAEGIDDDLTTIYTGNLITVGISALIAVVTFSVLDLVAPSGTGVAFPLLLGLVTGIATLVPAVGIKLVYVPYALFLLWQHVVGGGVPLWYPIVFLLVTLVVVDSIPDFFIRS